MVMPAQGALMLYAQMRHILDVSVRFFLERDCALLSSHMLYHIPLPQLAGAR